jgi:hypothetical protein
MGTGRPLRAGATSSHVSDVGEDLERIGLRTVVRIHRVRERVLRRRLALQHNILSVVEGDIEAEFRSELGNMSR